ncbi:anthrone oxygenase family protein [Nonomuraea guangzhouensis]|uniref:Anthrone oxygenase family protein n=1 Tax=Nonomuraea guangzhouensis TaxID=1291555 RepID=A0ABW4GXK6_9ACTN|nr:anthrone oxygenase family protein [Nonomuraea guangzhouensis]
MFELVSVLLSTLVVGVFWGPWLALSRSMASFEAAAFLAIAHRMNRNLATPMTVLMPLALASIVPVLFLSYGKQGFYLALVALALLVVALLVTVAVEVPIVKQIATWTVGTLPDDWQRLRDRWVSFHIVRVVAGIAGLAFLVAAAIF